jgi:hypothetical protein
LLLTKQTSKSSNPSRSTSYRDAEQHPSSGSEDGKDSFKRQHPSSGSADGNYGFKRQRRWKTQTGRSQSAQNNNAGWSSIHQAEAQMEKIASSGSADGKPKPGDPKALKIISRGGAAR